MIIMEKNILSYIRLEVRLSAKRVNINIISNIINQDKKEQIKIFSFLPIHLNQTCDELL